MKGILDTSVVIAAEQRRPLARHLVPDDGAVSMVTLAELELGVHLADGAAQLTERTETFERARAKYRAVPIDASVAAAYAEITAAARRRGRRPPVQDMWIAATAKAHAVSVYTQDSDFDEADGVEVVRV